MEKVSQQLDTLIVTQPAADPDHLEVCRVADVPTSDTPLMSEIDLRQRTAITSIDIGTYGIAYADSISRVYVHPVASIMPAGEEVISQGVVHQKQTFWTASPVSALAVAESRVLCGSQDGRLLGFSRDDQKGSQQPELIATGSSPWLALMPTDDDGWLAINHDGTWMLLDQNASLLTQGKLSVGDQQVDESHYCSKHQTLFYRVTPTGRASGKQWRAWSLADDQPLPLPDAIRFAPTLVAISGAVLAFNTQSGSWLGVPSGTGLEVQPLSDWPAGPAARIIPLDEHPVVLHLDSQGTLRAFTRQENAWQPRDLTLPRQPVANIWVARPGTWAQVHTDHQKQEAIQIAQQALKAHLEHEEAERDSLLTQLDQIPHGASRANVLRARIAEGEGRYLDIVERLTQSAIHAGGTLHVAMQRRLGKTLWHIGGLSQLAAFSPTLWPDIYPPEVSPEAPEIPDRLNQAVSAPTTPCFIDAFAPQPSEHCVWSEFAWSALKRWGSPGPCWIGANHQPPIDLLHGDHQLLPDIMKVCGGSSTPIQVLTPDGALTEHHAWVFSERISRNAHRQLLAYHCPLNLQNDPQGLSLGRGRGGMQLLLCWAIRAERFLSPRAWCNAWEAVYDHAWRQAHDHRIEIIHQALAHRIVPGNEVLGQLDLTTVDIQEEVTR